jgi:hypothetical protein
MLRFQTEQVDLKYHEDMLRIGFGAAAVFLLAGVNASAREYGPAIGTLLPSFELPDQAGKLHSLKGLLGPKGAVILFYRSADW